MKQVWALFALVALVMPVMCGCNMARSVTIHDGRIVVYESADQFVAVKHGGNATWQLVCAGNESMFPASETRLVAMAADGEILDSWTVDVNYTVQALLPAGTAKLLACRQYEEGLWSFGKLKV